MVFSALNVSKQLCPVLSLSEPFLKNPKNLGPFYPSPYCNRMEAPAGGKGVSSTSFSFSYSHLTPAFSFLLVAKQKLNACKKKRAGGHLPNSVGCLLSRTNVTFRWLKMVPTPKKT